MLDFWSGNTLKNVEDNRDILLGKKSNQPLYRVHMTMYRVVCNNLNRAWVFETVMKTASCAHTLASALGMQKCSPVTLYYYIRKCYNIIRGNKRPMLESNLVSSLGLCCNSATTACPMYKMKKASIYSQVIFLLSWRGNQASKLGDGFIVFAFVTTGDCRAYMINNDGLHEEWGCIEK